MNPYICLAIMSTYVEFVAGAFDPGTKRTPKHGYGSFNGLEHKLRKIEQRLQRAEERFKRIYKLHEDNMKRIEKSRDHAYKNMEILYQMANQCDRGKSHMRCLLTGECIHELLACDGHVDCADGTDEREDVCDDSVYTSGLSYKAYLAGNQTCFLDAKRVHLMVAYDAVTKWPHIPQILLFEGKLDLRYETLNGSEVFESRDLRGKYTLGSGYEYIWTVEKDPSAMLSIKTYVPYYVIETSLRSDIYKGNNPDPCGWCTWHI